MARLRGTHRHGGRHRATEHSRSRSQGGGRPHGRAAPRPQAETRLRQGRHCLFRLPHLRRHQEVPVARPPARALRDRRQEEREEDRHRRRRQPGRPRVHDFRHPPAPRLRPGEEEPRRILPGGGSRRHRVVHRREAEEGRRVQGSQGRHEGPRRIPQEEIRH